MKGNRRLVLIFSVISVFVFLFSQCVDSVKKATVAENAVAGSKTCIQCHKNVYESYLKNPHFSTTSPITEDSHLPQGGNTNVYNYDKHIKVAVEKRDSGLYQVVYLDGKEKLVKRFDVVFGSGQKAFTYATWKRNSLYQLPLSFFKSQNSWANSPGFSGDRPNFGRIIESRCLECHSSFVDHKAVKSGGLTVSDELVKSSLVYGINCERCHGPAGKHVEFHIENPKEKEAKFITLYKSLSRKQKVDACGVCHSGNDAEKLKPTFSFKPGDDLNQYYGHFSESFDESALDVHGKQNQMLSGSKCFIKSESLDCSTCHSTHDQNKVGLTAYSKKCISCHSTIKHTEKTLANAMVKTNCIDCHMPLKPSKLISFKEAGQSNVSPYMLRSHRIAVY